MQGHYLILNANISFSLQTLVATCEEDLDRPWRMESTGNRLHVLAHFHGAKLFATQSLTIYFSNDLQVKGLHCMPTSFKAPLSDQTVNSWGFRVHTIPWSDRENCVTGCLTVCPDRLISLSN